MPRPKEYASAAERQKAYRERRAKEAKVDPDLPVVDLSEPEPEKKMIPSPSSLPDLETYVANAVYMAELHHSQANPNATDSTKTLAGVIERAESYARWRYAGVLSGEVNGL